MSDNTITIPTTAAHVLYETKAEYTDHAETRQELWPVADYDEAGSPTCEDSDAILDNTGQLSLDLDTLDVQTLKNLLTASAEVLISKMSQENND